MINKGHIRAYHKRDFRGGPEQIIYELVDGPLVWIATRLLWEMDLMKDAQYPQIIKAFRPHKLIFVEAHLPWDAVEYVAVKTPLHYIYPLFRKFLNLLDLFYRRFIITLCVWGLAEYNEATVPCWHDIKVITKIKDWLKSKDV